MSFDDYANHIIQKYRIATAIAVLRTKPENTSIENHISTMREKIYMNRQDEEICDMDLDVISEDFDIEENEDEMENYYNNVARKNITSTGSDKAENKNSEKTISSNINKNTLKFILVSNTENSSGKMVDIGINEAVDDLHGIDERIGFRTINSNTRHSNNVGFNTYSIGNTENENEHIKMAEEQNKGIQNSKPNTNSNETDTIVINNNDIHETTSLNESVTMLENFDVNMAEESHSLNEVFGVLKYISHNKIYEVQKEFIDLTQSQNESVQATQLTTSDDTVNNNYSNVIQNEFIDLTPTHCETLKSLLINNITQEKAQTDKNNIKLNSKKSKEYIAQSLAKKIRKNLDKEKENAQYSTINIKNSTEVSQTIANANNYVETCKIIHKPVTETGYIHELNVKSNDRVRESIKEDIAAKVLQNINKVYALNQKKCEYVYDSITAMTSERIQTNVEQSEPNTCETHTPIDMDLNKTNNNDSVINFYNRNVNTNLQAETYNKSIANKILNNINKKLYEDNFDNDNIKQSSITKANIEDQSCRDTQDTILYSLQAFTQNYTHVSQSQNEHIEINDKFIHGTKKLPDYEITIAKSNQFVHDIKQIAANENTLYSYKTNEEENNTSNLVEESHQNPLQENQILNVQAHEIQYLIDKDGKMFKILTADGTRTFTGVITNNDINLTTDTNQNVALNVVGNQEMNVIDDNFGNPSQILHRNVKEFDPNNNNELGVQENVLYKNGQNSQVKTQDPVLNKDLTQHADPKTQTLDMATQNIDLNNSLIKSTDSGDDADFGQKEVISFKVIEELNKVKVFLNRTERCYSADGYTTDSGYRSSDSQSRSSYKSALQLSGNWLNQSAHCIYSFIVQCPLVASTEDICNEISVVLGRLIDKLHDEERYPPFIDDLFDTINAFLEDLHEGENDCQNVLQKKDENIRRLLLLNQSRHLLKYTIEKTTEILERTHQNLTNEEIYELTNIDQIENLSYIFFLLEKLLNRYVKVKNESYKFSQYNSQSQTEEKILKKSSISEIWRKKWNPEHKGDQKIDVCEDNNCLTKCGETLNKLIVDCMEGYSLVSFAALQCFNVLQK